MEAQLEATSSARIPATLGRYDLLGTLGQGGMANVYLARMSGTAGFQRLFAIKVLHPHLANEEAFVQMLLDEARIAARLHHPNVVPIVDLGEQAGFHYVVMEYVEGFALSAVLRKSAERPPRLLIPLILDALSGLHAAHSLTDEDGRPLNLVHRDVSPQNILVGSDGVARVIDFGIAKAESRINSTRPGELKGKLSFMSPEQLRTPEHVDFRSDVFSSGVLLWSALTGEQMFAGGSSAATLENILRMAIVPPSTVGLKPPAVLDAVCLQALERDLDRRTQSALEMEEALRAVAVENNLLGSRRDVAEWVRSTFADELKARRELVRRSTSRPALGSAHVSGTMAIGEVWRGPNSEGSYPGRETTLTPSRMSASRMAEEAECEVIVNESSHSSRSLLQTQVAFEHELSSGRRKLWFAAGFLLLLGGLGGVWFGRSGSGSAASASVAALPAPQLPPQPAHAELAPPAPKAAPEAPVAKATEPAPEPRVAAPGPAAAAKPRGVRPRVDVAPIKPAPRPTAEVAAPVAPPKRTTAWDSDSSLPPP